MAAAIGQTAETSKWERRRKLHPEQSHAFDLAESVPGPLRALALVRIAKSLNAKEAEWKSELLKEGFQAAAEAPANWPVDYQLPPGPGGIPTFLPQLVFKADKINSGLDRLTLQTSAVREMLPVDKPEARTLFAKISLADLSPSSCADALVPNVRSYYQTAAQVAKNGFTLNQKKRMEHVDFLRSLLASVSSEVEIGPAAQMLFDQHLPATDNDLLATIFGERLGNIAGDNRSFFERLDFTRGRVMELVDSLRGNAATAVLQGWRIYLTRNLSGVRCQETTDTTWPYANWATEAVKAFNLRAKRLGSVPAINKEDIKPAKIDSANLLQESAPLSREADDLLEKSMLLGIHGDEKDPEWMAQFTNYLNSVENLQRPDESESDLMLEKCNFLGTAAIAAPPGALREKVLERYVQLLKISNPQPEMLPAWYYEVHSFIDLMKSLNDDQERALSLFERSADPLLTLVAELYHLEPSKATTVPTPVIKGASNAPSIKNPQ